MAGLRPQVLTSLGMASSNEGPAISCPFLSYPWQDAHTRVHSGTGHSL